MLEMISRRCCRVRNVEFILGIILIWVVGLLMLWRVWGSCITPSVCEGPFPGSNPGLVKPTIPVYVVEEHHEVLLYWFAAAEKGFIKKKNNVLLHIDGHSDGATPENRTILPLFRWPSVKDIYNMMQRNDVFIVAAAATGLINRYIWVWPPWSIEEGENGLASHLVMNVNIGTVSRQDLDDQPMTDMCACVESGSPSVMAALQGQTCFMVNLTNQFSDDSNIEIDSDRCETKLENRLIEIVREDVAIELMKSGTWITSLDSVILDIDEDYYGCEPAIQPLYDVKISQLLLVWIQYFVSNLFCPSTPEGERKADNFYAHIIDTLINLKQFCDKMKNDTSGVCKDSKSILNFAQNQSDQMYNDLIEHNLRPIVCRSETITRKAVNRLMKYMSHLSTKQLKALKETGICFAQSPRTLYFDPAVGMKSCDGFNRPNETVVIFHTPTDSEVTLRTSQLKVMLSSDQLHPGIVTVCRSMRDGYTPRKFFHKIEKDVLDTLGQVFKDVDRDSIFYDPYLLGGVSGWPDRH